MTNSDDSGVVMPTNENQPNISLSQVNQYNMVNVGDSSSMSLAIEKLSKVDHRYADQMMDEFSKTLENNRQLLVQETELRRIQIMNESKKIEAEADGAKRQDKFRNSILYFVLFMLAFFFGISYLLIREKQYFFAVVNVAIFASVFAVSARYGNGEKTEDVKIPKLPL